MPNPPDLRQKIQDALAQFASGDLKTNTLDLFAALGYQSDKQTGLSEPTAQGFVDALGDNRFNPTNALISDWRYVDLVFQLTEAELYQAAQRSLFDAKAVDPDNYHSYLVFCLELSQPSYSRTALARITREINKMVKMPALVLFKHGATLTLAVIDRRLGKRDASKDVLEKITLIKDIRFANTHRAHIEILHDLSLSSLTHAHTVNNFATFHEAWRTVLDTSELNKKFFRELANWFYWAQAHVTFPDGAGKTKDERYATSLIRLITRLIFTWFIQEKDLVPGDLFDEDKVRALLNDFDPKSDTYYKAVLQNLFFGTLNTEMGARAFRHQAKSGGRADDYMTHNRYRYKNSFQDSDNWLDLTQNIPFLNGGLFECLDREVEQDGKKSIARIDGFSDHPENALAVPNFLFFAGHNEPKYFTTKDNARLNETFGTKNKNYEVRGLIRLLHRYKFTIDENTPIEQEIALDPELLGKVFENLLAAYNPETGVTARKQTGSFYTPREIVNYMVDESLIAYLSENLRNLRGFQNLEGLDTRLRHLLAYNNEPPQFNQTEIAALVEAIDNLKLLDPACGSGAFPMGALHKLVFILHKLDPDNARWKEKQIEKMREIPDPEQRDRAIQDVEQAFNRNELDYGRKLYLIENCIYGVDIQPIAVQIAKLRCFISLIVDERVDDKRDNRGIRPLPNLETKFVAANTLIGIEKPAQMMLRNPAIEQKEKELGEVRRSLFTARTRETKEKHRKRDAALRKEIGELLKKDGWLPGSANLLAAWDPYDQNAHAEFFDAEWMFGVTDGFDVVIGNPPYMRVQGIQQTQSEAMPYYRENFQSARGNFDLHVLFIERCYQLLDSDGQFAFIVPHKFFQASYGEPLRRLLSNRGALRQIVRFGSVQVFEEATTYTCLLFLSARRNIEFDLIEVKTLARGEEVLQAVRVRSPHPDYAYDKITAPVDDGKKLVWDFAIGEQQNILQRLQQHPQTLGDITRKIFVGLQTSADRIYVLEIVKELKDTIVCYSKLLDEEVEIERGLIKPFLMGKDVHRYEPMMPQNVVIFPYVVSHGKAELMQPNYIKRMFPLGWNYLKRNEADLASREKGRMRSLEFYAYIYPKNLAEFDTIKIMTPDICGKPEMSIDLAGNLYHTTTLYSFVFKPEIKKSQKFYLGVLNSKVMWYFLSVTGSVLRGGYLRFKTDYLRPFPIASSTLEQEEAIESLVDYVLLIKAQKEPKAMSALAEQRVMGAYFEQLIDAMVYEMYFPEEFADAGKSPIHLLKSESLPRLADIRGNKAEVLHTLFQKLYAPNHPIRSLIFFLDTVEVVKVIEAKSKLQ